MDRPELNRDISETDFRTFYWLKRELIDFCRRHGLPTSGSKFDLTDRIATFLSTGNVPQKNTKQARVSDNMPEQFTRDTVIGPNWRCSQHLRAFFVQEIGPRFHFNGVMREFIKQGQGKTLQEAIDVWYQEKENPRPEKEIAPQFEYNRHIREFFKKHPGKTLQDAIAAWKIKKAKRRRS